LSRLYVKWNEKKVYRPTRQNRFETAIGSIYYWKYCSISEHPPSTESLDPPLLYIRSNYSASKINILSPILYVFYILFVLHLIRDAELYLLFIAICNGGEGWDADDRLTHRQTKTNSSNFSIFVVVVSCRVVFWM
jgi:hypothetical protein